MADSQEINKRFFGYPQAIEGPNIPLKKKKDENPPLSGIPLLIAAWIVTSITFIQKYLWKNAGGDSFRKIKHLSIYAERLDPTVIPISNGLSASSTPKLDSESFTMLPENLPGRYRTVTEYHAMYLSGQLTPLAVAESLLPLIRRDLTSKSPHSISFIDIHPDSVLEAAKASTLRYKNGSSRGILDGVPTAIKDEMDLAGYPTTFGRKPNDKIFHIKTKSVWPIQKWEEAGVIVMGKTNMHELGADTTGNNPNWGTPRNPHNREYYTGGSSSGSAYAVAAGLVPFALGSDGGGSVRIPSSNCGIYGLKTSHNRLEVIGSTVTVRGPLAATMSDLEAAYRIMAVPNPYDSVCCHFTPPGAPTSGPKIIGIYQEWFDRADPIVLKLCNEAIQYYKTILNYEIIHISIPYIPEGQLAHVFTILADMTSGVQANPASTSDWLADLNTANKVLLLMGDQTPTRDYMLAQRLRNLIMQHLAFLYTKYPGMLIVTPTTPIPCWPIAHEGDLMYGFTDGNSSIRNMEYAWLANFSGCPAISCPVGYVDPVKGKGKVPIGLMAMGEWGSEDALIGWGKDAERWLNEAYPGGRQRPENWEDVVALAQKSTEGSD